MSMISGFCYSPYFYYICLAIIIKFFNNMPKNNFYAVAIGTYYLSSIDENNVDWTYSPTMAKIFTDYNKAYSYVRKLRKMKRYSCTFVEKLKPDNYASWAWNQIISNAM